MRALSFLSTCALVCLVSSVHAQSSASVRTEARDTALGYMGTGNFLIGRIGRDCLSVVGRTESPKEFVQTWQRRNAKYVLAAAKYMEVRLAEAAAAGGQERRNALLADMQSRSQAAANGLLQSWYASGPKEHVCKRATEMVDTGELDVSPSVKVFAELEALVQWAQ